MWPKIWRRCALWPSCAKQRCWRTCGQGPCWDRRCWCLQGYQETLQTGCPCEPVPCGRRDSARPGNRKPHWQSEGEVSYRESQCRRVQRNLAQVMLRCCRQSRRGSGSGGEGREQYYYCYLLYICHSISVCPRVMCFVIYQWSFLDLLSSRTLRSCFSDSVTQRCSTETQPRIPVCLLHPDGFKMSLLSLPLLTRFWFYLRA